MSNMIFDRTRINRWEKVLIIGLTFIFVQVFTVANFSAQTPQPSPTPNPNLPKVTQIDTPMLLSLVKREGESKKPLVVNFWATWCGPCVEEFPDLVKIDEDYRGKIDFITISMDDLADINTTVPEFLGKVKAKMPAYLLKTDDEEATINSITKDWQGGLPFTVIYNEKGEISYFKQGKIKPEDVRKEIDKVTAGKTAALEVLNLPINSQSKYSYEKGVEDANKDIASGKLIVRRYGMTIAIPNQPEIRKKYGVEYIEYGCSVSDGLMAYIKGYNEISTAAIKRKFGKNASKNISLE